MKNSVYVAIMATVAAMGGLLFGFDTGVISGAIPFLQRDFGISDSQVELLTTMGLLGAVFGALVSGNITERIGRRRVILSVAVIFSAGALWAGLAPDTAQLMAARFLLGIGIGTASFSVPLYIAEISPARNRGALVSLFQLMITLGILVSYLSDLGFADEQNIKCWKPKRKKIKNNLFRVWIFCRLRLNITQTLIARGIFCHEFCNRKQKPLPSGQQLYHEPHLG